MMALDLDCLFILVLNIIVKISHTTRFISLENICAIDGIENEDPYELLIEKKSYNFDLNAIFGSNEE